MSTRAQTLKPEAQGAHWYKNAIIYQLHVKSFFDSNNDGVGDFEGLIAKLDYIANLGVNTIWLLPFYPSPLRDDGYDIAEYCAVHPDYGSIDDVRQFIDEAHRRDLRVITELVINHTSDQHPWFQRARKAPPDSPERNFYVWSDNDKGYSGTRIIFVDTEKSNWAWDPEAQAYYWHRFYSHQPDLNFDNPAVLDAVLDVMSYWFDMGVDGMRLDAVPYLVEREGTNNENLPETHEVLKKIRAVVDKKYPGRMLLAEANQWPEDTQMYFGEGDECHMAFHFPLMPRMYIALAQEDRFPITDILRQTPGIPDICQWAVFLRNHDELTLEMVTSKERDYLWNEYASEARARLNLGIRRRLAPLLQKDRRRIELMHSLLLSMPGTPILYYGDEIGMGDNIFLGDRDGVRTPMQWSPDRNGGFSKADPARIMLPVIMDALYGYTAVNVEAQNHDSHSLLNWVRTMLEIRKRFQAFGRGTLKMLYPRNRRVLAYIREYEPYTEDEHREEILCVANMSRSAQAVELDLSMFNGLVPLEMTGGSLFPPIGELNYLLTLPPYGFYWFLLAEETQFPDWYVQPPEPLPDFMTFVLRRDVSEVMEGKTKSTLEKDVLPAYLTKRRWFGGKGSNIQSVHIDKVLTVPATSTGNNADDAKQAPIMLCEIEVDFGEYAHRYQLPLSAVFEDEHPSALAQQLALARVRYKQHVGFLTDAVALEHFTRRLIRHLRESAERGAQPDALQFHVTSAFAGAKLGADHADVRVLSGEQSNSSIIVGEQAVLKVFRRLFPGPNPEVEISRALTEQGFANTAALLGYVARGNSDDDMHVLAVLQGFIPSQGDGWAWVLSKLDRLHNEGANKVVQAAVHRDEWGVDEAGVIEEIARFAHATGLRLAQMHQALAAEIHDPAFAPESVDEEVRDLWIKAIGAQLDAALAQLQRRLDSLSDAHRHVAEQLIAQREEILGAIATLAGKGIGSLLIRIHGDLHLGQILVAQNDAYFIDFEGEPTKSVAERRAKTSPLRDVAGMLRSFDYAAEVQPTRGGVLDDNSVANQRKFLSHFKTTVTDAFLNAYFAEAQSLNHRWQNRDGPQALTDLFALEKAAYEIGYEAAQRPQWIHIPLLGLAGIVAKRGVRIEM